MKNVMNAATVNFVCFAPRPLSATERAVLGILRNARGFYRSSGMSLGMIALLLAKTPITKRQIPLAIESLLANGRIITRSEGWRVK